MRSPKMLLCAIALMSAVSAQTVPPADAPPPEPSITQIRKSVTFVKLRCKEGAQEFDVKGTGFFVSYPDERLGKDGQFVYLVTNRHVALCWNDLGHAMQVENISIRLNRKQPEGANFSQEGFLNERGNIPWIAPRDDSVDLAVFPFLPDMTRFDFKVVPLKMFATADVLAQNKITEGEPVLYAGFFQQSPEQSECNL